MSHYISNPAVHPPRFQSAITALRPVNVFPFFPPIHSFTQNILTSDIYMRKKTLLSTNLIRFRYKLFVWNCVLTRFYPKVGLAMRFFEWKSLSVELTSEFNIGLALLIILLNMNGWIVCGYCVKQDNECR